MARLTLFSGSPRPYSIKTRIKTPLWPYEAPLEYVRNHIPLKQGLRLVLCAYSQYVKGPRPYSIKTRIKTIHKKELSVRTTHVRDHIPLKQGLRLGYSL